MAKIEVKNVYKIFGPSPNKVLPKVKSGMEKDAVLESTGHTVGLNDISLSIEEGKVFVVMGLSGSGKSTLIRHFNRLIDPTAGEILIDGVDILSLSDAELVEYRRHKMSMVFQRFGLMPHRNIRENVSYGLAVQGVAKTVRAEKAQEWINSVGLTGYEDAYPDQLSGGMQQRVGLARALCTDPEILLMDEAFSALDPLIRREMQDQLDELQSRLHKTIVFITHDLDEALRLGDRIAILKDGALVQVGTAEEILLHPANEYVEAFVKDVNRVRVIRAATVMLDVHTLVRDTENPAVAFRRIQESDHDYAYVVNKDRHLQGVITADQAEEAQSQESWKNWEGDLQSCDTVLPDTVLEELLPLTLKTDWPVSVVNEQGQIIGVVPRRSVIAALSDQPVITEETAAKPPNGG